MVQKYFLKKQSKKYYSWENWVVERKRKARRRKRRREATAAIANGAF